MLCVRAVASYYWNGWSVKEDDAEAARWFRRGAELGDTSSMFHLARFLLNGKAVPADTPAAIALFERAARDGS